jgi:hypothetical protein
VDAIILGLLPAVLFAVAGAVLIVYLRNRDEGDRYQHEEYRPEQPPGTGNGTAGNGHGPPGRGGKLG